MPCGRRSRASSGLLSEGCRCLTGLRECRGFFDRRKPEEEPGECGARLVVQLSCDPSPLGLLAFEDRVDGFAFHAFREMNGEGRACYECFGEANIIVGESGVEPAPVEGGNSADCFSVRHQREEER